MTSGRHIGVLGEKSLTVAQAAREFDVNPSTIWRWRTKGVRGIKLRAAIVGGRTYIRQSDLEQFLGHLNAGQSAEAENLEARAALAGVA